MGARESGKFVLFVLAGRTDVRIVIDGIAKEIDRSVTRAIHDEILQGRRKVTLNAGEAYPISRERCESIPDGPLELYSDKLAFAGGAICASLGIADKPVGAVVVLNTHRDQGLRFSQEEPVALGWLLSSWLASQHGLAEGGTEGVIGPGLAGWVDFLTGRMPADETGSSSVNRVGMHHIEQAIVQFPASDGWQAILFEGGGMPAYKEPVREALRMHFATSGSDGAPLCFRMPESASRPTPIDSIAKPEDSYRARQHALRHLERGDFLSAYAIAETVGNHPCELPWIREVEAAAQFFSGEPVALPSPRPALQRLLKLAQDHSFVSSALRTESALRQGNTVAAMLGTFSFFDALLTETAKQVLNGEKGWSWEMGREDVLAWLNAGTPSSKHHPLPEALIAFTSTGASINTYFKGTVAWCERSPQYYPALGGVAHIWTRIKPLKQRRNAATHSSLTPEQAREVRQKLELGDEPLWGTNDPYFLGQPLVQRAIAQVLKDDLHAAYKQMVADLENVLVRHPAVGLPRDSV